MTPTKKPLTRRDDPPQVPRAYSDALRIAPACGSYPNARWYVVQTHPLAEFHALQELAKQRFRAHLPLFIARTAKGNASIRPLFPCYLFVEFSTTHEQWRPIASTKGVARLFSTTPERPIPVPIGVVEALMAKGRAGDGIIDDRAPAFAPILVGSQVKVSGVFEGFPGVCSLSDGDRVTVLMTVFGRTSPVNVARADVEVVG